MATQILRGFIHNLNGYSMHADTKFFTYYKNMATEYGFLFVSGLGLQVGEDREHLTIKGHELLSQRVLKTFVSYCENLKEESL